MCRFRLKTALAYPVAHASRLRWHGDRPIADSRSGRPIAPLVQPKYRDWFLGAPAHGATIEINIRSRRYGGGPVAKEKAVTIDGMQRTPDRMVSVRECFGIDSSLMVPMFDERDDHVPEIDTAYRFNAQVTLAILAGFTYNRRVMVQGLHGTGKSTHIEQVAARLNWPCVRVNLDGHISRLDLVGKDAIVVRDERQITEFQEGIVPWALQRPVALIFDEYDAGRPDVMFVIQRILERDGSLTLLDQNRVIRPHPSFRLFATSNTVGLGNLNGLYHGTQMLNHAQMDRWNVVATLSYLPREDETGIVLARVPELADDAGRALVESMVAMAALTRKGFATGDLSTLMSPRTVINWAENCQIFRDPELAFRLTFLNKCDEAEWPIVSEYYQRCFGVELGEAATVGAADGRADRAVPQASR
ncbi:hypothetical protein LMG24076_03507 [Trinickia soli]|nr:hypothetical protein LMG24076_03507 [Trinickia soli]